MMSERLFEFDPEAELREAFECFDEGDTGTVKADEMRKWMSEVGERMDQQEVGFAPALTFACLILCPDRQVP
jgi:myosin regulatory light chain 12